MELYSKESICEVLLSVKVKVAGDGEGRSEVEYAKIIGLYS